MHTVELTAAEAVAELKKLKTVMKDGLAHAMTSETMATEDKQMLTAVYERRITALKMAIARLDTRPTRVYRENGYRGHALGARVS